MIESPLFRPVVFLITIVLMLIAETMRPEFKRAYKTRLKTNILIFLTSIFAIKIVYPFGLYAITDKLNGAYSPIALRELPFVLDLLITILLFDLMIYWQHRLFHIIPILWRFHEVHHSDKAMDISTAFRFHPGEIIISGGLKILLLILLTPRIEVFFLYEAILNSMAIFNHSNFKLSIKLERALRLIIVTPQMHYPHHSPNKKFTNSNYGNFLSVWDKLFNSYTKIQNTNFGLDQINKTDANSFTFQIGNPFQPRIKE